MIDGQHRIEWTDVPAMTWAFGDHAATPACRRGFCLACDELFIAEPVVAPNQTDSAIPCDCGAQHGGRRPHDPHCSRWTS